MKKDFVRTVIILVCIVLILYIVLPVVGILKIELQINLVLVLWDSMNVEPNVNLVCHLVKLVLLKQIVLIVTMQHQDLFTSLIIVDLVLILVLHVQI